MIRYSLNCANGHQFESWFQSAGAYDVLSQAGHLECPECGNAQIKKAMMSPRVAVRNTAPALPTASQETPSQVPSGPGPVAGTAPPPPEAPSLSDPNTPAPGVPAAQQVGANMPAHLRAAMEKLRTEVEKNSDYVGRSFVKEARAMHEGASPERAIHGEANAEEAKAMIEDGIPILPLPFRDKRGSN